MRRERRLDKGQKKRTGDKKESVNKERKKRRRRKRQIQKTNEMEPGRRRKKKQIKLKFLTSEHHLTPSMYELKSACVVVSKNRTGVVVALAEFVTVENRAPSISTKTNPAIAFSCVETFFIGQKTSCSTNKRENRRQSRAFPVLRISYFID